MTNVTETRGALRLRIEPHENPDPPYDEGSAPILRVERGLITQVTETTNYRVSPRILEAAERWGAGSNTFVRYLRAFHGVTRTDQYNSSFGRTVYLSFDPADWRESLGLTDEYLAEHPDVDPAGMGEWKAYCEGEVYGYVVERCVGWHRVADGSQVTTWEVVDDCWGFYGYEYAQEAGREALAEADDATPDSTVTVKVELAMTYKPADYRLAYGESDDKGAPEYLASQLLGLWARMDWGTPTGAQVASVTRAERSNPS